MARAVYSIILLVVFLLSLITNWYEPLGIALITVLLVRILYKIGKGIVLLEVTALLYAFTCVIMPLVGYANYSGSNALSKLWARSMPVNQDIYFSYALPAIAGFCLAITLPAFKKHSPDEGKVLTEIVNKIKLQLSKHANIGLQIMLTGIIISLGSAFLPASLGYFATLFFFGSFAGLLYIYFSPGLKYKKAIILLFVVFILYNALQSGMFTIVAYMSITIFSFFQLGKQSFMLKKIALLFVAILFFIVLQNVKGNFRKNTWGKTFEGNKVELFSSLFIENLQKGSSLLTNDAFFPLYTRTNQGFNVAMVMKRMPAMKPFDNGDRLLTVFASALVPRFLWPDKPEAGGAFNMEYYAGFKIRGWSTNIGPLGEAYGSFGVTGGIIYMFLLGLFIRWAYMQIFKISDRIPLLMCWVSVFFFQVISSEETDSLQVFNSLFKAAFFVWLLFKFLPHWFGITKIKMIPGTNRAVTKVS